MSEYDSISRTIRRKGMQGTRREIPAYTDSIYRPPPKQIEIPLQVIPGKCTDLDIDILEQDINMYLKKIPISRRYDIRNVPKA